MKPKTKKKKPEGHGRNGADAYEGAKKIEVPHASLKSGDPCPECEKGKVYVLPDPRKLVRVKGQAPLSATVYELERLRCSGKHRPPKAASTECSPDTGRKTGATS